MEAVSETEAGAEQVEKVPSSKGLTAPAAANAIAEFVNEADHNPMFDALVTPEEDVTGLVAYSLYKQYKRSWLDAFITTTGRAPTDAESRAYIIGESTERRLNTYRHLAAETLAGLGPRPLAANGAAHKAPPIVGALWTLVVILALVVIGLAQHAGYLTLNK